MNRKIAIIALYLIFLVSCFFVLKEKNICWFSVIYLSLGLAALFFYNSNRKLFLSTINYLFVGYEFMVLLLASSWEWKHRLLNRDYANESVFMFFLFSAPTIFYIADAVFQRKKSK